MPNFDGFTVEEQVNEVQFEAAVYGLLEGNPDIRASRLLYSRVPVEFQGTKTAPPVDLSARRLFVFEKSEGTNSIWKGLNAGARVTIPPSRYPWYFLTVETCRTCYLTSSLIYVPRCSIS